MIRLPEERREKDIADHAHQREIICNQFNMCLEMKKKPSVFKNTRSYRRLKNHAQSLKRLSRWGGIMVGP